MTRTDLYPGGWYAYVPRSDGSAPVGGDTQTIIRDLATLRGVLRRMRGFHRGWQGRTVRVYRFTDWTRDETYRLVYEGEVPR